MANLPLGRLCKVHQYAEDLRCVECGIPKKGTHQRYVFDFWRKVNRNGPDGCWIWMGCLEQDGYGQCDPYWGCRKAHRVAWEYYNGKLPRFGEEDVEIDHLCRVKRCVNPDHLEVVRHRENLARRPGAGLCKRGHPLVGENRMAYGRTVRCRTCYSARLQRQRDERRARGLKKPGRKKCADLKR